jgi:hypothetical protein
MRDWREDYIICDHVYQNEALGTKHKRFKVCREKCYQKGFLDLENYTKKETKGNLTVYTI